MIPETPRNTKQTETMTTTNSIRSEFLADNLRTAQSVLAFVAGIDDAEGYCLTYRADDNSLLFYAAECGIGDNEQVLIERVEPDSFGDCDPDVVGAADLLEMIWDEYIA